MENDPLMTLSQANLRIIKQVICGRCLPFSSKQFDIMGDEGETEQRQCLIFQC